MTCSMIFKPAPTTTTTSPSKPSNDSSEVTCDPASAMTFDPRVGHWGGQQQNHPPEGLYRTTSSVRDTPTLTHGGPPWRRGGGKGDDEMEAVVMPTPSQRKEGLCGVWPVAAVTQTKDKTP
ncbi:unnamed protein product [Lota lota]